MQQLVRNGLRDVVKIEPAGLARYLGVKHHLHEHIAQFFPESEIVG